MYADGWRRLTFSMNMQRWARCSDGRGSFNHLFFSDDPIDLARAKAMCSRCVLRAACLAGALERGEAWGVWGGEIFVDGEVVADECPSVPVVA